MSVEVAIICDGCGRLIDANKSAGRARAAIRESDQNATDGRRCKVGLPGGRDYCWDCTPRAASPESEG